MNQETYQDRPTMAKWNKLVAAVNAMPKIATGTYTGDGAAGREITLGFRPKFMVIVRKPSTSYEWDSNGVFGFDGMMCSVCRKAGYPYTSCEFTDDGFAIRHDSASGMNVDGDPYQYFAIG